MKTLTLLLACILCGNIYGQLPVSHMSFDINSYDNLDNVNSCFTYKLIYLPDADNKKLKYTDMQVLQIGSRMSKYFSRYMIDYGENIIKLKKEGKIKGTIPGNPERGTQSYEIYKDYPAPGKMTFNDRYSDFKPFYQYEEPVPSFDWKLAEEFREILGYRCQKATTSFRGRNYTAWFAKEIPVGNGPWKFGGLPGLIMKITDSENHYNFECVGVEQPKNETIKFYKGKYSRSTARIWQKYTSGCTKT